MSSLSRLIRNAAHTKAFGRPPEVSSDTNAPQNPGPTNWPCRQEFSRSPIQRSRDYRRTQTGSVTYCNGSREIACGGCPAAAGSDLNKEAIPLIDKIRFHLFDVSNLTPTGVHQPTRANHSSKSIPTVLCLASNASSRNYVVEPGEQRPR